MSRLAITGGRGRLAPFVVSDLRAVGHDVISFSRTPGDGHEDLSLLTQSNHTFDTVLHLGWSTVPLISEEQPGREHRDDLPFLRSLLNACVTQQTRIIFFSTAAVYGNTTTPTTEEAICEPLGRYASAKLDAEKIVLSSSPGHCVLRVSNVFGFPGQSTKPQGVIPRLCEAVQTGIPLTIWGNGTGTKDYLGHTDFLAAIRAAVAFPIGGIFNVASGKSFSLNEIIALTEATAGKKIAIRTHPHFPWDVEHTCLSFEKFSRATGWRPLRGIPTVIRELLTNA